MNNVTETPVLSHLQDKAIRAHNWTSFSPEKRGEQMIKDYSEELTADIEELQKDENISAETIADYKNRYERLFSSYLGAKSNTFSAMITGPANFNTRRHTKANRSEERHYDIFREWRIRAKKAIVRKAQPVKTFVSELDRYRAELAIMQANQIKTKEGNKVIAKAKKTGEDITQYLADTFNVQSHMMDWVKKFGFNTVNNNANMKRVEARIKELEVKESRREESPFINYTFEGGTMVVNYEADRIQIMFATRPNKDELNAWKAKGLNSFNWSPTANAWQRKITANAMWTVKHMLPNLIKL
ncbi:MAG: hypothetical protein V4538_15410 [Bacteroidota bacterium]